MPSSGCGAAALVRTFGVEEELLPVNALTVTPAAAAEGLTGFLRNRSGSRRQRPAYGRRGDFSDVVRNAAEATPAAKPCAGRTGMRERTGSRNIRGYPD
jgi:hypothetical protein